jgi:cytochrome c oxidase subunit IV
MTETQRPPRSLVLSWIALLALLGSTVFIAYLPLGIANTVIAMTIAVLKGAVVATVFMELWDRNPLTLTFAGAGFFWLGIMLWLALTDYITRPNFPPDIHWGS